MQNAKLLHRVHDLQDACLDQWCEAFTYATAEPAIACGKNAKMLLRYNLF